MQVHNGHLIMYGHNLLFNFRKIQWPLSFYPDEKEIHLRYSVLQYSYDPKFSWL